MKRIKYSLIIPHFNTPQLLNRLLNSVPKRDDLEVIVVDDCSTKDITILNTIKQTFPYVFFYSTETNGGGGKARNIGLNYALGDYVFFADSDDYFTPGINRILDIYASPQSDYDLIFFDTQAVNSETYTPSHRANHLNRYIKLYESDQAKSELHLKYLFGEPWCKLIKRNIIIKNNLRFEERPVHNDTYFSYMVGFYSKKISVCPIVGYCLTERPVSTSTYGFTDKWLIRTEVFSEKNLFLKKHHILIFDDLLLSPFILAIRNDRTELEKLFRITSKYGFSKSFMTKKIFQQYLKRILHKLRLKRKIK